MGGKDTFYLDRKAWQEGGGVDLRRKSRRSDLNMLSLGCLLDTKIETWSRQLHTDVWGSEKRHSRSCKRERPE